MFGSESSHDPSEAPGNTGRAKSSARALFARDFSG
jgi:hypothetical protein